MMEVNQANPAKAGEIAQRIVEILSDEDSETRRRAIQAAMMLLGEVPSPLILRKQPEKEDKGDAQADLAQFFDRGEKLKPSDHAHLCAAYHYSIHGAVAFSMDEIRKIAADAGVVLPDRLDMTFRNAAHGGRKLFQPAGKGAFRPTASAGVVFKEQWAIKPGKAAKATLPVKE